MMLVFTARARGRFAALVQQITRPCPSHDNFTRGQRDEQDDAGSQSGWNPGSLIATADEGPPQPKEQGYRGDESGEKITDAGRHASPGGAPARSFACATHVRASGSGEKVIRGVVAQVCYSQGIG